MHYMQQLLPLSWMKQVTRIPNMLIKHKFIEDMYQHKLVMPTFVTILAMKAGILTKIMPGLTFVRLQTMIGVKPPRYRDGKIRVECGLKLDIWRTNHTFPDIWIIWLVVSSIDYPIGRGQGWMYICIIHAWSRWKYIVWDRTGRVQGIDLHAKIHVIWRRKYVNELEDEFGRHERFSMYTD